MYLTVKKGKSLFGFPHYKMNDFVYEVITLTFHDSYLPVPRVSRNIKFGTRVQYFF